jgi:hypothetical protein
MLYTGKQIVKKIKSHIKNRGGTYASWVVGVSSDARSRLFKKHGVEKKVDRWILIHAESARVARHVKSYLIDKLGIMGNKTAPEDEAAADFVYAYKKSERTQP